MKTVEWVAVVAVLGIGIGSQLLRHDHSAMSGHDHASAMGEHGAATSMAMENDTHTTVTLAVTGMT